MLANSSVCRGGADPESRFAQSRAHDAVVGGEAHTGKGSLK